MSILVVYYSRSGNTRRVAEAVASACDATLLELVDTANRAGFKGYMKSGKDAMLSKRTEIEPPKQRADEYDLVIVGTPVWAFTMTPAVRTYLEQERNAIRKAAFFCTMGGSGANRTFNTMKRTCGKTPCATLALSERESKSEKLDKFVAGFVEEINKASAQDPENC